MLQNIMIAFIKVYDFNLLIRKWIIFKTYLNNYNFKTYSCQQLFHLDHNAPLFAFSINKKCRS